MPLLRKLRQFCSSNELNNNHESETIAFPGMSLRCVALISEMNQDGWPAYKHKFQLGNSKVKGIISFLISTIHSEDLFLFKFYISMRDYKRILIFFLHFPVKDELVFDTIM